MSRSLAHAAGGLSLLACLSAGVALLREVTLAATFGASASVDAYLVALSIPFLLSTTIVSSVESAFVPVYISCGTESGPTAASRFAGAAHFWLLVLGLALTAGVCLAIPVLLPLLAPGFPADRTALARQLAWLTAPSILFSSLYAAGRSVLNAEGRFLAPAAAPAVGAGVMILVIVLGGQAWGIGTAAVGFTAGTAAMWLTVYIPVRAAHLPGAALVVERASPDVVRLLNAARPLLLGVVAMSAIPIVDRFMASRFPEGVISALAYADRVVQIPIAIVATAVTTATFPTLARDAALRNFENLRQTLHQGINLVALVLLPAAVLMVVLSGDLVSLLFEHGRFGADDARMTAATVVGLAAGMVFAGTFQLVPRVFNALLLAPFVMLSGFLNLGFKAAFNVLLVPLLGYVGFAVATSAMYVATGSIMLALLSRRMNGLNLKALLPSLGAMTLGAAFMTLAAAVVLRLVDGTLMRVIAAGTVATIVYAATVWKLQARFEQLTALEPVASRGQPAVREAI